MIHILASAASETLCLNLLSPHWPLSGNCIDFSIVPHVVFHLSSVFSVNCEGSRCFTPDSLMSCRLFLILCRAVKGTRSDFIYRLSVPGAHYLFFGKSGVFFSFFFCCCCCFCFNKRYPCLRVYVETQAFIKTFLSHSLIWLQQVPNELIQNNLSIHC